MKATQENPLKELYKLAAGTANKQGIMPGNQTALVQWIRANCNYRPDTEYFLVLGIGCELADIQARAQGYNNDVHRAYNLATMSLCFPEY